ncbi:hypothetical protein M0R45_019216 [Rubus argutus]|uniref:Uncharacterized protein n=1 Tax=Rubus argutus TaxID=59490 RepID=A0AAW1X5K8_RUBAR
MALLCTHRAFALSNPCLKSTTSVNPSSLPHYPPRHISTTMATKPQIPHLHCALPSSMPHNPTLPAISNPPFSASLSQAHHQIDALPRRAPSLFEPTATRTEEER